MYAKGNLDSVKDLFKAASALGLLEKSSIEQNCTVGNVEKFRKMVIIAGRNFEAQDLDAFQDEKKEHGIGIRSRTLDVGQDDYVDVNDEAGYESLRRELADSSMEGNHRGHCFKTLCKSFGFDSGHLTTSPRDLPKDMLIALSSQRDCKILVEWYGERDGRNHVERVDASATTGALSYSISADNGSKAVVKCITVPQEFFNKGGRFYNSSFYAEDPIAGMSDPGAIFGGDLSGNRPPAPESVVDGHSRGGSANITGGVTRSRRRVVRSKGVVEKDVGSMRNYAVAGITMFNNVDEIYLDTISREYAQEILEALFDRWGLPTDDAGAMQYAEDLVWAFLVARTASNKADYDAEFSIPTKHGDIDVNFSRFSILLADQYGITRRNFARGVADDIRAYLKRPENQFIRSRSAQRVNADPQYGHLCFDGSTGCTNMSSSDVTFCRVLESRNLYEREDVIAEGASDRLMQGMHGGVRSKVPR